MAKVGARNARKRDEARQRARRRQIHSHVGGGVDGDDDEGVDKAAFQGSGSSHHLAAAESESNNRLSRDS